MHEVLVNRLGGLSLPRKSVVRLTDRPDMTLDVYRGRKTTIQQQQQQQHISTTCMTNAYFFRGSNSAIFSFASFPNWLESTLAGKRLILKLFPLKYDPILVVPCLQVKFIVCHKIVSSVKIVEKSWCIRMQLTRLIAFQLK